MTWRKLLEWGEVLQRYRDLKLFSASDTAGCSAGRQASMLLDVLVRAVGHGGDFRVPLTLLFYGTPALATPFADLGPPLANKIVQAFEKTKR